MKLRMKMLCRAGAWIAICAATLIFAWQARAAAVSTTTVQGTVYLANGAVGSGTLQLSWPAFTTADNLAVAAGRTSVSIGADGFVSVNLAPNLGASPAGLYYTAVYHMSDGTTSTEYWVVPEAAQASLTAVRAQVMPAAQAAQAASKAYVDNAIAAVAQGTLTPVGGALSGPLYLNGDPTQSLQAADKHYVDSTFSASVPLAGGTMLGGLTGPSVTASLNKVLLVTAPPYNAQCDGVTDDQAAIQAAFNDAYSKGYSVEFPAGTCLTSTITIKGQSFFGHGKYVTTIVGQPGQDVFATPDPSTSPVIRQSAHIHDLSIQVNATVDASASAAGGNNTFPYRVTGTAGGLTALPQAPAPGPIVFGSAVPGNCAGQIIADSNGVFDEFYQPCANFTNLNAEFNGAHMAGQPISVYNTSGALVLATTITGVIDATHLQLAGSVAAAQSSLSGEYMNALTAPWYIGNCGFAFPMADGSHNGGGNGSLNGWVFENISIGQVSTSLRQANHTCGIFVQANNYALNYEHVDTAMLYGGIIEALPYQNASYVTWAPDTTKYLDVNLSHHILPLVTYNGTHRILDGVSIYGGAWDSPQGMGAWMLAALTGGSSGLAAYAANASLSRFYFECASYVSGELERFSGQSTTLIGGSPTQCGASGNLGLWMTPGYLNWNVSDGSLDGQVGVNLQINGDHNSLTHTDLKLGSVTDNGFENRVQTGINNSDANLKRAFYANLDMPQDPVGKLTGDFLLNGDSSAPFVSGSDLLTTCRDYRTLTPLCVNDPGGTELSRSYIHVLANAGSVSGISTGSVASWNALMTAGSRIPLTQVYVVAQGRCQGAASCSSTFYVRDRVTGNTLGSCTYTFGSSWTVQGGASSNPCLINFSGVPMGDAVGWDTNSWTATGLTAVDISFVGFQPQHADIVSEVVTSAQLAGAIQSGAAGVPVNITAANWHWGSTGPGVMDASSPTGYSTAIGNAWSLTSWGGGTNLNGGALYPAVPSTISYLVQAPTVLTNSLAAAMAATDTSLAVTVPVTSGYASGGCFQIDQEIACYSGTLTAGATTIAVSRGQYGTLPQAHASGATVSTVGTGTFYAACSGTNYASTNVVFGANWSYVSSPFAAQNCSGASTAIHLSFANGPTGQTYKVAAVQIAQNSGNPQATGSNQVTISANAGGNGQYGWTATKSLAGSGAAIPTGPAASTSGNITTFASGNGQIQDSGIALSSVASLSSASQQTFAGPIAASTNATINVQDGRYKLACDGTTDDTTAFQAAVTAGEASGALLIFPANATCVIKSPITITGVVRWQGSNTTIAMSPTSLTQDAFGASGNITALDISGFTFQGNSNVVSTFLLASGTLQNINFHNNIFTSFTGCPVSPNAWPSTQIEFRAATNVKIKDNQFLANGCSSYWSTGGPTGSAIFNYTSNPSYNWEVSGNTVNNTYADMGFLLFNLYDSTIHDNTIQNVVLGGSGGGNDSNSSGYGIAIYAVSICGGATAASPSGLSRTSNVVTVNFSTACSPALAAGDTFNIYGSASVGGTGFDGAYTVVTGGTTSVTATLDTGTSLANDTGGAGAVQWSPRRDRVHDNDIQNTAGMGIYFQGVVDSTAHDNVFSNVCTGIDDTSLPCGFVSLNGTQRVSVSGNDGTRSTKDGIISASSVGTTAYGNNLGGARYGLRLRGAETKEVWLGNTINGGTKSIQIDSGAVSNVILGNASVGASAAHIAFTSGAGENLVVANQMDGGNIASVTGVQAVGGSSNLFLMNAARGFRGSAFDIRGPYNLVGFNYAYGGSGIGISSGNASYTLFTRNYLINQGTGFNDSGGGSNILADNYFENVSTRITGLNGLAFGNHLDGGVAGVYPFGSCTLVSGACTITTAEVQSTDNGKIWCTRGSTGANPGFPYVSAITAGTSFVVTSTSATDTGNVSCRIQH